MATNQTDCCSCVHIPWREIFVSKIPGRHADGAAQAAYDNGYYWISHNGQLYSVHYDRDTRKVFAHATEVLITPR